MKVKNNNNAYSVITYIREVSENILKYIHLISIESSEIIKNEMIIDLKRYLLDSSNIINQYLENNQKELIVELNNKILNTFSHVNKLKRNNCDDVNIYHELKELALYILSLIDKIYQITGDNSVYRIIDQNFIEEQYKLFKISNKLYTEEVLCLNGFITENFNYVYNNTIHGLMESLFQKITNILNKIQDSFKNKHDKILVRDKKWLNDNKKNILNKNYDDIQLEILTDNTVTFENLMNRHNTFDKIFVNSHNINNLTSKLSRFEDKRGDLKNGIENYFRTGTSKREIGTRKVTGQEAKTAVENMIAYCDSFMLGRKYIDGKIDIIVNDLEKNKELKESVDYSYLFFNEYNPFRTKTLLEAVRDEDEVLNLEDDENDVEKNKMDTVSNVNRTMRDRQIGVAVLLTVAEDRYFDYMQILHGLAK